MTTFRKVRMGKRGFCSILLTLASGCAPNLKWRGRQPGRPQGLPSRATPAPPMAVPLSPPVHAVSEAPVELAGWRIYQGGWLRGDCLRPPRPHGDGQYHCTQTKFHLIAPRFRLATPDQPKHSGVELWTLARERGHFRSQKDQCPSKEASTQLRVPSELGQPIVEFRTLGVTGNFGRLRSAKVQ